MEYLNNIWKNRILKGKKSFSEFEQYFGEINDSKLKAGETKNAEEIDKLLSKLNTIPTVDLAKFGKEKMMKKR